MAERPSVEEFRRLLTSYWCNACNLGGAAVRIDFATPGSLKEKALADRSDSLERKSIEQEAQLLAMFRAALEPK